MKIDEIKDLIETAKRVNINDINSTDETISNNIKIIYEFIQNLDVNYFELIEKLSSTNIRFCDYYDSSNFHGDEIIDYFKQSYEGEEKDENCEVFSLYVSLKNVIDLVYNVDLCDTWDELYELLDNDEYFKDVLYTINYLEERRLSREFEQANQLEFLNSDNKYKILFSGFSYKDIKDLQKHVKKAFINKISGPLCKNDVIPHAESVDHVKDLYGFPLFRIQFADDYRIAYIRKNNVTAILGATLKTGKELDYTRYDSIAKNSDDIYQEIDDFINGKLSNDSDHYKTLEHLEAFYGKLK